MLFFEESSNIANTLQVVWLATMVIELDDKVSQSDDGEGQLLNAARPLVMGEKVADHSLATIVCTVFL